MTAPTIGDTRRALERAQSGLTAPTDAETIEALAASLDTTPADLLTHAVESVRIPCHRLPSCILGPDHEGRCVVIGRDPTETPKRMTDADVARLLLSQAPTRYGGMKLHNLDCPDCSCEVFERAVDLFGDGESEHCRSCGSLVTISTDEDSPVDVSIYEHGGDVVARLLAGSTVLEAVVEALEDPARPEESPVDAVRRLLAEVERLTPDTPGAVSDHLRTRVAEACQECADGECADVPAGCIPGHQAGDLLDAYDDARAGFAAAAENCERLCAESVGRGVTIERLTHVLDALVEEYLDEDDDNEALVTAHREHWERCVIDERRPAVARLVDFVRGRTSHYRVARMATMAEDEVELLEREVGTHESTIGDLKTRLLAEGMTVAALEQERDAARRTVCDERRLACAFEVTSAAIARDLGWGYLYPEDSTPAPSFDALIGKLPSDLDDEAFLALATADDGPGGDQ